MGAITFSNPSFVRLFPNGEGTIVDLDSTEKMKLSIGEKIEVTFQIEVEDGIDGTQIIFNPALFCPAPDGQSSAAGYKTSPSASSNAWLPMVPTGNVNTYNHKAEFRKLNIIKGEIRFCFYVSSDVQSYLPVAADNSLFLTATNNQLGGYLNDCYPSSGYRQDCAYICYTVRVSRIENGSQVNDYALSETTGQLFEAWPVQLSWYNKDCFANEIRAMGADECERGLTGFKDTTEKFYDNNYFQSQEFQMSVFDNTDVTFAVNCNRAPAGTIIDEVKAILICETGITNDEGPSEVIAAEMMLMPDPTVMVPNSYLDISGGNQQGLFASVQFDKDLLEFGKCYRIALVIYDNTNNCTFSTLSPKICADAVPACFPRIRCYLGNACKESETAAAIFSKHEKIKSRVDVDFDKYFDCLSKVGIQATMDDFLFASFSEATGPVSATDPTNTLGNHYASSYIVNRLSTGAYVEAQNNPFTNGTIVSSSGTELELCAETCIPSDFDSVSASPNLGTTFAVEWKFAFELTLPDGTIYRHNFSLFKKIGVRDFQDEVDNPVLCVTVFDYDKYQNGIKEPVVNICDAEKIMIEVEKKGFNLGESGVLTANIYETFADSTTFKDSIQVENSPAGTSILPQSTTPLISNLPVIFSENITTFCVDVKGDFTCKGNGLRQDRQYYVDAIFQKKPPPQPCCAATRDSIRFAYELDKDCCLDVDLDIGNDQCGVIQQVILYRLKSGDPFVPYDSLNKPCEGWGAGAQLIIVVAFEGDCPAWDRILDIDVSSCFCEPMIVSGGFIDCEFDEFCNQLITFNFNIRYSSCCEVGTNNQIAFTGTLEANGQTIRQFTTEPISWVDSPMIEMPGLTSAELCELSAGDVLTIRLTPGEPTFEGSDCDIQNDLQAEYTKQLTITEEMIACCKECCEKTREEITYEYSFNDDCELIVDLNIGNDECGVDSKRIVYRKLIPGTNVPYSFYNANNPPSVVWTDQVQLRLDVFFKDCPTWTEIEIINVPERCLPKPCCVETRESITHEYSFDDNCCLIASLTIGNDECGVEEKNIYFKKSASSEYELYDANNPPCNNWGDGSSIKIEVTFDDCPIYEVEEVLVVPANCTPQCCGPNDINFICENQDGCLILSYETDCDVTLISYRYRPINNSQWTVYDPANPPCDLTGIYESEAMFAAEGCPDIGPLFNECDFDGKAEPCCGSNDINFMCANVDGCLILSFETDCNVQLVGYRYRPINSSQWLDYDVNNPPCGLVGVHESEATFTQISGCPAIGPLYNECDFESEPPGPPCCEDTRPALEGTDVAYKLEDKCLTVSPITGCGIEKVEYGLSVNGGEFLPFDADEKVCLCCTLECITTCGINSPTQFKIDIEQIVNCEILSAEVTIDVDGNVFTQTLTGPFPNNTIVHSIQPTIADLASFYKHSVEVTTRTGVLKCTQWIDYLGDGTLDCEFVRIFPDATRDNVVALGADTVDVKAIISFDGCPDLELVTSVPPPDCNACCVENEQFLRTLEAPLDLYKITAGAGALSDGVYAGLSITDLKFARRQACNLDLNVEASIDQTNWVEGNLVQLADFTNRPRLNLDVFGISGLDVVFYNAATGDLTLEHIIRDTFTVITSGATVTVTINGVTYPMTNQGGNPFVSPVINIPNLAIGTQYSVNAIWNGCNITNVFEIVSLANAADVQPVRICWCLPPPQNTLIYTRLRVDYTNDQCNKPTEYIEGLTIDLSGEFCFDVPQ